MTFPTRGYALAQNEGDAFWFLGSRMTVKALGAVTDDAFTLIDCECPSGFSPPPHVHEIEDEAFYVVDGELRVGLDGRSWNIRPGGFALLPKGIPHSIEVVGNGPARVLQITAPAQFEHFVAEVGQPADGPGLPGPGPVDVERLIASATRHRIKIMLPAEA